MGLIQLAKWFHVRRQVTRRLIWCERNKVKAVPSTMLTGTRDQPKAIRTREQMKLPNEVAAADET